MKLKKAYLGQVLAPLKEVKEYNRKFEEYDLNLTKPTSKKKKLPKILIRKVYVEGEIFT